MISQTGMISDCQSLQDNTDSEVTALEAVTTLAHYDITDCHSLQGNTESEVAALVAVTTLAHYDITD